MTPQTLSVVVIGRNEGARLRRCLHSVAGMERHGLEVETIYVDSGSSDGSVAAAASLGAKIIHLQPTRPTAALGRNVGWRQATGEIVLFLDGDTLLDPRFVAESFTGFDEEQVAVIWGHRRETLETNSLYNRVLDLDWIYPPGDTGFCGGDALFRRSILEATGGYDDTLIAGEEPELCRRITALGYRVVHVDRPMTGHDLAITRFNQYWKRATRAGHAFAEVSSRFAATENPFWLAESRNNQRRALFFVILIMAAILGSLILRSFLPAVTASALIALLAIRTAWKARWKSRDWPILLFYGLHSHLQQIPIFFGQVQFWRNQRSGRRAGLVEYKRP